MDPEWLCHVVESPVAEAFMMKTINDLIELLIHVYYTVDRSSSRQSSTLDLVSEFSPSDR